MLSNTPTLYFPYYQNLWNIIKFKSDKEQLIWFRTMSKMMFENMEKPKEPIVSFTSEDDRIVWDAYNTILPALSKVMKISKFNTAEFREQARINGRKGGRPRKDRGYTSDSTSLCDSYVDDDTSFIPTEETVRTAVLGPSSEEIEGAIVCSASKDERISSHIKSMKAKFPDINAFTEWVKANVPPLNFNIIRDETCRTYIFERLWETGFCEAKTGEPIKNLFNVINKIFHVYSLHKREILANKQGRTKEVAIANEEKQHEDALEDFYQKRSKATKAT